MRLCGKLCRRKLCHKSPCGKSPLTALRKLDRCYAEYCMTARLQQQMRCIDSPKWHIRSRLAAHLIDCWCMTHMWQRDGNHHILQVVVHTALILYVDITLTATCRRPAVDSQGHQRLILTLEAPLEHSKFTACRTPGITDGQLGQKVLTADMTHCAQHPLLTTAAFSSLIPFVSYLITFTSP